VLSAGARARWRLVAVQGVGAMITAMQSLPSVQQHGEVVASHDVPAPMAGRG
jgi:hypothetical protein